MCIAAHKAFYIWALLMAKPYSVTTNNEIMLDMESNLGPQLIKASKLPYSSCTSTAKPNCMFCPAGIEYQKHTAYVGSGSHL